MSLSRRALLYGGSAIVLAVGAASLPGGGPRSLLEGTPPALDAAPIGTLFSPTEQRAELAWLRKVLLEVGVAPFAYVARDSWERRYADLAAALNDPSDIYRFYLSAAPLFASLNDGHVKLSLFAADHLARSARILPLALQIRDNRLFVVGQSVSDVPNGSQVLAVNKMSARQLIEEGLSLTGGQHLSIREAFVGGRILSYLLCVDRNAKFFTLELLFPDGTRTRIVTPALTLPETNAEARRLHKNESFEPYVFSRIAGGRIGYINYRECVDFDRFAGFLHQTFSSIKTHPIDGLIIDIRNNGGGNW